MQKPSNTILATVAIFTWVSLVFIAKNDSKVFRKEQIGTIETLRKSAFARTMFLDIGALSSIIAGWMIWSTKSKLRYIFGFATTFVGSFAALPFIAGWLSLRKE